VRLSRRYYVLVKGKPPYHPRDLAGLYLYGMLNRNRSSRQLESACYNRLDVIWLMEGQTPDHSTIADFVKVHGKHLRNVFRDVLKIASEAGLIKLGHVAVDGTKIEADAGRKSVHKKETLSGKRSAIRRLSRLRDLCSCVTVLQRSEQGPDGQAGSI